MKSETVVSGNGSRKGNNKFSKIVSEVDMSSRHLIPKKDIYQMERAIKEQLFARTPIEIRIKESFHLSEQYTPEKSFS